MNAAVICKWMGGWTYQQYRVCPTPMLEAILEAIRDEAERYGNG